MAINDITVLQEQANGSFKETLLTPAAIGAAPSAHQHSINAITDFSERPLFHARIEGTNFLFNTLNDTDYIIPWNSILTSGLIKGSTSAFSDNNIVITPLPGGEWITFRARYTSFDIVTPGSFMRLRLRSSSSPITQANGGDLLSTMAQIFTVTTENGRAMVEGQFSTFIQNTTYFAVVMRHTGAGGGGGYPVFFDDSGLQPFVIVKKGV